MGRQETFGIAILAAVSRILLQLVCELILMALGPRCNGAQGAGVGLATCLCLHAEENALLEAGRERIRGGSILYCDTFVLPSAFCVRDG